MALRPAFQALDEGTRLRALADGFEDPRFALTGVGALLVETSQEAFRAQRMGGIKWKDRGETRMVPNWPGVLRDLQDGKSPPARRFQPRPVLQDGGTLYGSLSFRVVSNDTVEAGSMLPYAGPLHAGLPTYSVVITKSIQQRLWEWIKRLTGAANRAEAAPERRETKEKRAAVKNDGEAAGLRESIARAKSAYRGQRMPKDERERVARLESRLKERARQVANVAGSHSEEMTSREAAKVASSRQMAHGANSLRWLLNPHLTGKRKEIKHPARPIVGIPPTLVQRIEALYGAKVKAA